MMEDNNPMTPVEEEPDLREPEAAPGETEITSAPMPAEEGEADPRPVPPEEFAAEPEPVQEGPQEPAEAPVPSVEENIPIPQEPAQNGPYEPFTTPVPPAAQPVMPPQGYPQPQWQPPQAPVYPQAPVFRQEAPVYGEPQTAPQYAQPQYGQAQYPQQPYGQQVYGQPVYPPQYYYPQPKKKMSKGLKVFIWIASILAGLAILSFAAYFAYSAVNAVKTESPVWEQPSVEKPHAIPENPFKLPEEHGEEEEPHSDGGNENPGFGDSPTPPDADDPVPDVDVTPNHEGITVKQPPKGGELSAKEVYEQVIRSTVTVTASQKNNGVERSSMGTGIVATSDGYIITNAHVVYSSKSTRVKITTSDNEEYDAVVVGVDRTTDLAVLKTNDHNFSPAEFGDSEQLSIGDSVIAIGNPGGAKFSGSMTGGYVSGLDRLVGKYSENGMTYIQTDAAINPGNSGGPLVNMYGQVVGINSSKIMVDGFEGMGFAIPITKAQPIINELLAGGYVKGRVRLGISGVDTDNLGNYMFSGGPSGFMISSINEDSAFIGTDAQEGDVIVGLDGETVTCLAEISNLLLKYSPGDTVTISLYRPVNFGSGESFDVEIVLLEDKGETQK